MSATQRPDPWPELSAQRIDLRDRVVLITGASGTIGGAVARCCAAQGATTILNGRHLGRLEQLYDEIDAAGHPQAAIFALDLATATAEDYTRMVDAIDGMFGTLHGLVHAAGTLGQLCPVEHADVGHWQRTLDTNLSAPFRLTHYCLPLLCRADDASVVFTLDEKQRAYWGAYAVANAGVRALARVLADEWQQPPGEVRESGSRHVRINAVRPGATRSQLRRAAYPAEDSNALPDAERLLPAYLYFLSAGGEGVNGRLADEAGARLVPL